MKRMFISSLAMLFLMTAQAQSQWRMMSYNIRNARGMDGLVDYQRVANVILCEQPDVVAVQEVDSVTGRSGKRYVLDEVATRTGMHCTFAPAIDYDGGKYGIGILSRAVPLKVEAHPLPGSEEARTVVFAEFDHYVFCCTHLSLTEKDRIRSVDLIKNLAKDIRKPFFLAGDFNDEPGSAFIQALQRDFDILTDTTSYTFPAKEPKVTIDYIVSFRCTGKGVKVVDRKVVVEPMASDHRPVVVEVRKK